MRTILLVLFFALGLVAEPIPCEGGVISFNFGRVQKTGVLKHDFIISNPTEDNTVIESIKADCSCTSVISGDWLIKPGGQTRIECSLSAEGIRGKFKKEVSVQLASPDKLMFKLVLEGEVIPSIILSMDAIFITKIQRTAKIKKEISIMSGDGTALEIKRVHTKCDFISVGYKTNGKGQKL